MTLPCEVRRGVQCVRADANDQHIAATSIDTGSEYKIIPRVGGVAENLIIVRAIPLAEGSYQRAGAMLA